MKRYKVWVEIEVYDDETDEFHDASEEGILPDPLGEFDSLEAVKAHVWEINEQFGSNAEHSDCRPEYADSQPSRAAND